jgi:hypothetical protein
MKKQKSRNQKWFKKQMKKRGEQFTKSTPLKSNIPNYGILDELTDELLKLESKNYLTNETISNRTDLRYIISTNNIPNEIKTDVKRLISIKKPRLGQCLWYSKFISSQIPGVNQIFGLFKVEYFQFLSSEIPTNQITEKNGSVFYKDENENVWGIHSWNEYKGVHFDCLKDSIFDYYPKKEFIKYTIVQKYENKIKPELSLLFNINYEIISSSLG